MIHCASNDTNHVQEQFRIAKIHNFQTKIKTCDLASTSWFRESTAENLKLGLFQKMKVLSWCSWGSNQCRKLFFSVILLGMQSAFKTLVCKSLVASENLKTSTDVVSYFFFIYFLLLQLLILLIFNKLISCRSIGIITLDKTNRQGES